MLSKGIHPQRGASLIEVLVTLVVLGIGLLGMAGLQTLSIKGTYSSYYRSQATFLAHDMTERMRANYKVARDKNSAYYTVKFPASSNKNNISSDDLAKRDIAQWLNDLADTLPNGTGSITREGDLVVLEVRWNDSRGAIQASDDDLINTAETFAYRTEI
ncbi:MAG TPA: type IV pilus modification protein PilV [Thiopseudomonas sp.]|nr:type IV pilus modification protein PilV [Thiopseudomonas sp.]